MVENRLSEKLRQLRKANGLNQIDIAAALNIEQSTYSGYETGKHSPNPDMLYKIADFYGINIEVLMRLAVRNEMTDENKRYPADKDPAATKDLSSVMNDNSSYVASMQAEELSQYLSFINDPANIPKGKVLSKKEMTAIYHFSRLSEVDQDDFIEFMKIRARH